MAVARLRRYRTAKLLAMTIWCNAELSEAAWAELRDGTSGHRLVAAEGATSNLAAGGRSETLAEADVAFGQPDPDQVIALPSIRWVHITSAGYTRYDTPEFREAISSREGAFTNSSSVYDDPCAQHLLAFMLATSRRLPQAWEAQRTGTWDFPAIRPRTRVLRDDLVLIVGQGAIGRRLTELLTPFGVRVVGLRRRPSGEERSIEELEEWLPKADHVVNILPASSSTGGFFGAARFAAMKPGSAFYNVGRGTTVDQAALIDALTSGRLTSAYLDVTDPEPLPSDHPLWRAPNCFITPHVAGGLQEETQELVRHFLRNLRRLEAGEPLTDRVA